MVLGNKGCPFSARICLFVVFVIPCVDIQSLSLSSLLHYAPLIQFYFSISRQFFLCFSICLSSSFCLPVSTSRPTSYCASTSVCALSSASSSVASPSVCLYIWCLTKCSFLGDAWCSRSATTSVAFLSRLIDHHIKKPTVAITLGIIVAYLHTRSPQTRFVQAIPIVYFDDIAHYNVAHNLAVNKSDLLFLHSVLHRPNIVTVCCLSNSG